MWEGHKGTRPGPAWHRRGWGLTLGLTHCAGLSAFGMFKFSISKKIKGGKKEKVIVEQGYTGECPCFWKIHGEIFRGT